MSKFKKGDKVLYTGNESDVIKEQKIRGYFEISETHTFMSGHVCYGIKNKWFMLLEKEVVSYDKKELIDYVLGDNND